LHPYITTKVSKHILKVLYVLTEDRTDYLAYLFWTDLAWYRHILDFVATSDDARNVLENITVVAEPA
jgi:hypothetical protein